MIFHRKYPSHWPLFFFGFIALGIIVSTAVLIALVSSKYNSKGFSKILPISSPSFLAGQYNVKIDELIQMASSTEKDLSKAFAGAEYTFFNVRVPSEMREKHLSALFKIMELKKENEKGFNIKIKEELIKTLEALKY